MRKDGSSSGYGGDAAYPGNGGGIMFPRRVGGNFPGDGVDGTERGGIVPLLSREGGRQQQLLLQDQQQLLLQRAAEAEQEICSGRMLEELQRYFLQLLLQEYLLQTAGRSCMISSV